MLNIPSALPQAQSRSAPQQPLPAEGTGTCCPAYPHSVALLELLTLDSASPLVQWLDCDAYQQLLTLDSSSALAHSLLDSASLAEHSLLC